MSLYEIEQAPYTRIGCGNDHQFTAQYIQTFPNGKRLQHDARCILWASDADVLARYFIRDGKFTFEKLLQPSDGKSECYREFCERYRPYLRAELNGRNPVEYAEILDEHTIFLLLCPRLPFFPKLFRSLLKESSEYDVIYAPAWLPVKCEYTAERYTNRLDDAKTDSIESYSYVDVHFPFDDLSKRHEFPLMCHGDFQNVKRLHEMVMSYSPNQELYLPNLQYPEYYPH